MNHKFYKEEILIGKDNIKKLENKHIALFGIGGVGSFVAEALARAGIGKLTIIDFDKIEKSNINRQIHANFETIGKLKTDVMSKRIKKINPSINIKKISLKYNEKNHTKIFNKNWDYIIDAIDMVSSKLFLIEKAKENNINIISSMGTANKIKPSLFKITDIFDTKMCPLARVMRRELRKRNIKDVKVLYSDEKPKNFNGDLRKKGTLSFVPSIAGLMIAGEVIRDIIDYES
ncbi:MAG: tRNA threonylcarbamoyladenosine dehydratase [Bacillota bacterium]